MDVTAKFRDIITDTIKFIHSDATPEVVKTILNLTQNLLFLLDDTKSSSYKIAITCEYLEGLETIFNVNSVSELRLYLQTLKSSQDQAQACTAVQNVLEQYINLELLSPQIVVFWLQKSCGPQELKKMGAIMLFLSKEQQEQILKRERDLLSDPVFQKLKNGLALLD